MQNSPREILLQTPMGRLQVIAVGLCIGLNALDGFDVLSISFASPGIAAEWGIDRAALGVILSAELIGMALGSALLGGIADKIGRRPTILICLVLMTIGMFLAATAGAMTSLLAYRFGTGLGIGGMLASINAMTAEYSNAKRRNLAVTLMAGGYPAGAIVGGTIASFLLVGFDWRAVFVFGGFVTLAFIPLVWFLMPESIEFLQHKRPPGALERINHTLRRMGHKTVESLPERTEEPAKPSIARLFSPALIRTTTVLTLAYFAVIGAMVVAMIFVVIFGYAQADLATLSVVSAFAGFFTNAAIVGLYAIFAQSFPTELRASGTGFVIGVGRGGAALAPIIAGVLFVIGASAPTVATIMGCGALFAAIALFFLPRKEQILTN
ncbi:MAG: MFS transporter [Woeseiaceae bacterium]